MPRWTRQPPLSRGCSLAPARACTTHSRTRRGTSSTVMSPPGQHRHARIRPVPHTPYREIAPQACRGDPQGRRVRLFCQTDPASLSKVVRTGRWGGASRRKPLICSLWPLEARRMCARDAAGGEAQTPPTSLQVRVTRKFLENFCGDQASPGLPFPFSGAPARPTCCTRVCPRRSAFLPVPLAARATTRARWPTGTGEPLFRGEPASGGPAKTPTGSGPRCGAPPRSWQLGRVALGCPSGTAISPSHTAAGSRSARWA